MIHPASRFSTENHSHFVVLSYGIVSEGWPRLNSVKRLWVAHPSTQSKDGVSSLIPFLISIFQFLGAISFSVFETICDADVLPPGEKGGPASGRETGQRCARRRPWL